MIQLTRVMALELMRDNVQVNVLCPGYFMTDLNKEFFGSAAGQSMVQKRIPMRRVGRLEELQSAALYLATCPPYLTGTELYIDGEQHDRVSQHSLFSRCIIDNLSDVLGELHLFGQLTQPLIHNSLALG